MRDSDGSETPHVYEPDEDETATEAVVAAVAEATGRSHVEMDPLVEAVDPDALDSVVDPAADARSVTVSFGYAGCDVVAHPDEIRVRVSE